MAGGFRTCGPTGGEFELHSSDTASRPRGPAGVHDEPDPFLYGEIWDDCHWHGYRYSRQSFWDSATDRLERWRERTADSLASFVDSVTLRATASQIARDELDHWTTNNLTENRRAGQIRIQRYWRVGVRRMVTRSQAREKAWSAVFIDFVLRQAGAGVSFRYAWKHVTYVHAAIQNLERNHANTFKAYKIDDPRSAPGVGDLVCNWRETRRTYDEIAAMARPHGYTHCDLVVSRDPGGRKIQLVGGNKTGGKVGQVEIDLDQNGLVVNNPQGLYIAVLKHS